MNNGHWAAMQEWIMGRCCDNWKVEKNRGMKIYLCDVGLCQMVPIEGFSIPFQTIIETKKGYPRQKIKMIFMAHVLLVENNP